MSPLREFDETDGVIYYVDDVTKIRTSYSLGTAFHAVRSELIDLHSWSDTSQQIGSHFLGIFGLQATAVGLAHSDQAAASLLQGALISSLSAIDYPDDAQKDLRTRVLGLLGALDTNTSPDPFRVVFDEVVRLAANLYGANWPEDVGCVFEVIGDPPYNSSQFWITAYTVLDEKSLHEPPSVHLCINPDQLNIETYSAIFAILVHECFCHVPAHRVRQRNDSPFSEGFCDWAAYQLFKRWLLEFDPSLASAAQHFGEQICVLMKTRGGGNRFWKSRVYGHAVAGKLVRMFIDSGEHGDVAVNLVIKLARELVIVDEPLNLKDSFVRRNGGPISEDTRRQLLGWRAGITDASGVLH